MRLKVFTTGLLVFGVLLLFATPWLLGPRPGGTGRDAQEYVVKFGLLVIGLFTIFATTAILAVIVARRERQKFREEAMENLKDLVESSLRDHGRES